MKSLEEIKKIKASVVNDLMEIPGVSGVDVGKKIVDGKKTDIDSIRVYVKEKRKEVPEDEEIPKEIQGVPTDVIERTFVLH